MEKEGGRMGVVRFLCCSLGEGALVGSSSVRDRVTGAMDVLGRGAPLEISGVDCA